MTSALDYFPEKINLSSLRKAAKNCEGCHLYKYATQTVFGNGTLRACLMMVGEIPGNKEDITGVAFSGPAGTLLRDSVEKAGLEIDDVYFTNVVKHFKYINKNYRRLHRSPNTVEIKACIPWLEAEMDLIEPQVIVCLGATAAKALISKSFRLTEQRGKIIPYEKSKIILATFHPSAILRAPSHDDRKKMRLTLEKDIKKIVRYIG